MRCRGGSKHQNSDKFKSQGFVHSNNANIFYSCYGSGIPLILLHGNMQDASYFKKQIDYFSQFYRVVAVDSRGHGKSEFGQVRLTLDMLSKDIENLMASLEIESAIILGFSDGGNIAIKLAFDNPKKIMAVIAISPNLTPEGLKKWVKIPVELLYQLCRLLDSLQWFDKKAQVLSLMLHEPNMSSIELNQIKIPLLILAGQNDFIHKNHIQMIASELPNAKLTVIENSGHDLLITHADSANTHILSFLKTVILENN